MPLWRQIMQPFTKQSAVKAKIFLLGSNELLNGLISFSPASKERLKNYDDIK